MTLVYLLGRVGVPTEVSVLCAAATRLLTTGVTFLVGIISVNILGTRR